MQTMLLQNLAKRDMDIQANHEHKEKHGIENQSHM